jgi:D-sedoheptulose 7-phosphate isomerase
MRSLQKNYPSFFVTYFSTISSKISNIDFALLRSAAELMLRVKDGGKKVIFVGNGGSAAMASHLSVDLTKASGIRAINFNEADLLTCFSNDYGYEHWVARALEAYADKDDLAVLISSSGRSPNIINGVSRARDMGLPVITLSGFQPDNPLRKLGDINFWCDSDSYNVVEMTHHVWLLAIADYIASELGDLGAT